MENLGVEEAIKQAIDKYKEEFGQDVKIEDGEEFVTVFNNCVLIISYNEEGGLHVHFIEGKPYAVDKEVQIL